MTQPASLPLVSLDHLDVISRQQAEQAQAAMRELIALIPRCFSYEDEIDLVFLPDHAR